MAAKSLRAFLYPTKPENVEIVISERFKDEDGNPVKWELRPLSLGEAQALADECQKTDAKGNKQFDVKAYNRKLVAKSVVFPDLKDAELQSQYAVLGEDALLNTMLTYGEYLRLFAKVDEINSAKDDDINTLVKEAKN